mmetsp:Transcript_9297/g.11176  ORF Transcript_9297/g.11176 Transcript_9297/m.11176 type:complete len:87 (-) Transcript_9297:672-932(-)
MTLTLSFTLARPLLLSSNVNTNIYNSVCLYSFDGGVLFPSSSFSLKDRLDRAFGGGLFALGDTGLVGFLARGEVGEREEEGFLVNG